jgi:hypothetical protein
MTAPKPSPRSWWLEPGTETCPFCEVRFQFEAACYCSECDEPICPACVVQIFATRQVLCPECHNAQERS